MTLPLPLLIALLIIAVSGLIVALAYIAAPVIHDALTVEPVRPDAGEYDNE